MAFSREALLSSGNFKKVEIGKSPIDALATELSTVVIGQEEAARALASGEIRTRAGLKDPKRPDGVYMFLGPTGVGKSQMAKTLARSKYGQDWEKHFLRIDCTDLQEHHSVRRLTGSDPTYVGYGDPTLISQEFLTQEGGVVILVDELEKAHSNVWKAFLPVMEEGKMTVFAPTDKGAASGAKDAKEIAPTELDFRHATIIYTSNTGAAELQNERQGKAHIGIKQDVFDAKKGSTTRSIGMDALRQTFKGVPEFLGRVGEENMIVFQDLKPEHYDKIFDITLKELSQTVPIDVTAELKQELITLAVGKGQYGARDLRSTIEAKLMSKVAEARCSDSVKAGQFLVADTEGGEVIFWTLDPDAHSDLASEPTGARQSGIILPGSVGFALMPANS